VLFRSTVGLFDQDLVLSSVTPSGTTAEKVFQCAANLQPNVAPTADCNITWPQPSADSVNNIADLVHAGLNGHGGFYSAGNPNAFANGIKDALRRVADNIGSGASLAANSTRLDTGTTTYQAVYFTGEWKGNLRAFAVDPTTGTIAATPEWEASSKMPAAASRNIFTCTGTCVGDAQKVSFLSSSTFDSKTSLGADATAQATMISYLRGTNVDGLRIRSTSLGDIVNSQPVFVGPTAASTAFANFTFPGAGRYPAFATANANRAKRLYLAANDGMLHAFDAASGSAGGVETFAYLPKAVIQSGVKDISSVNYGRTVPHKFYNDGEMAISDVYLPGYDGCPSLPTESESCWRTVLVGSTGRGPAKAVYALDITTPGSQKLLWERAAGDGQTNANFIGQVVGKPAIAQVEQGGSKKWVALVSNGYKIGRAHV
jgi:type IV pilus assembly protein PilY1